MKAFALVLLCIGFSGPALADGHTSIMNVFVGANEKLQNVEHDPIVHISANLNRYDFMQNHFPVYASESAIILNVTDQGLHMGHEVHSLEGDTK